jgi:hypothetical protein
LVRQVRSRVGRQIDVAVWVAGLKFATEVVGRPRLNQL